MLLACNVIIEETLYNFTDTNGEAVDVAYMDYQGHAERYVVYGEIHKSGAYASDNFTAGYFSNIDFQVYSKTNFLGIIEALLSRLEPKGFIYQPELDSNDMYDPDTGYYHKTICLGYPIQLVREWEQNEDIIIPIDDIAFPLLLVTDNEN